MWTTNTNPTFYSKQTITQGSVTNYNADISYNYALRPYNGIETRDLPRSTYWNAVGDLPNNGIMLLNLDNVIDGSDSGLLLLENDAAEYDLGFQ